MSAASMDLNTGDLEHMVYCSEIEWFIESLFLYKSFNNL
jgi:hypothetical protein